MTSKATYAIGTVIGTTLLGLTKSIKGSKSITLKESTSAFFDFTIIFTLPEFLNQQEKDDIILRCYGLENDHNITFHDIWINTQHSLHKYMEEGSWLLATCTIEAGTFIDNPTFGDLFKQLKIEINELISNISNISNIAPINVNNPISIGPSRAQREYFFHCFQLENTKIKSETERNHDYEVNVSMKSDKTFKNEEIKFRLSNISSHFFVAGSDGKPLKTVDNQSIRRR